MFTKKNAKVEEEQIMQEVTDEQLSQVTGGASLTNEVFGLLGKTTGTATGLLTSVSVSGVQISAAGAYVSTPDVSTSGLISGLL